MAESFVFHIADSILGKLASYAYEEASKVYAVYEDLQGFKDTLSIVSGLLLDAEEKKNQQHALREWLRQIKIICYDAEDVLDEFELHNKKKQIVEASGSTWKKVHHFFSSSNPLAFRLETLIVRSFGSLKSLPFYIIPELEALSVIDCESLNLCQREPHICHYRMGRCKMTFLHLENKIPWLSNLPAWIEEAVETLQTLILINLDLLRKLPECFTIMSRLKKLHIAGCSALYDLPSGMQHLTCLEDLTIDGCPKLCRKCKRPSGEYWPMISHIKRVSIGEPGVEEPQEGWGSLFNNTDLLPYLW